MKITKDMVGKKVRQSEWPWGYWVEILYVGDSGCYVRGAEGSEGIQYLDGPWELYEEPKKPKLMAPAICENLLGHKFVSTDLFESEEDARKGKAHQFFSWPAIPNKDGYYEVPDE